MRAAEKFLLVAGIGRNMYSKWRLQRMMASMVTMAMLAIIASVMASVLMIGGFYALYLLLLDKGTDPLAALLMIGVAVLSLTVVLATSIKQRLRELKASFDTSATGTVDAFFDGLFSK